MEPYELTATQAVALLKQRQLSCEELTLSCLRRIERRDSEVQAWIAVDPELALARARVLDASTAVAPLKGLPIGFKDIIATSDLPTCYNSPLYAKQKIGRDAACVTVVRECGGTVLGKTDTVEFASGARRARTRNPHNLSHTPGGSSSGSAAAVADFHVPLSFGTQTGGSIIRPAAFNGIYAIKPTHGLASYEGIKHVAPSLDTLGWYGRAIDDLRLVADAFKIPSLSASPRPARDRLRIGLCQTPMWDRADQDQRDALGAVAKRLSDAGTEVIPFVLPESFARLSDAAYRIVDWEIGIVFRSEHLKFGKELDERLRAKVEKSGNLNPASILQDYNLAANCRIEFERLLADRRVDAILTPPAAGEAPEGLQNTGDSIFCTMWTLLHVPCIAMPCGRGRGGLPLGVQLIGPRFADAHILSIAQEIAVAVNAPFQMA